MNLFRTNSSNTDFKELCFQLDNELNKRYGKVQSKYDKHHVSIIAREKWITKYMLLPGPLVIPGCRCMSIAPVIYSSTFIKLIIVLLETTGKHDITYSPVILVHLCFSRGLSS